LIAYSLVFSVIAAILLAATQAAYGYPTFMDQAVPAKWTDLYFSICISNTADPRYEKMFVNAVEQWKSAWPNFEYIVHSGQTGCDINVNITKDVVGLPKDQHSLGTTRIGYWYGNNIVNADITIPTQLKQEVKQGNYCCKALIYEFSEKKFNLIALHEFGHALGLAHPEDDGAEPFDVMYAMGEHNQYVISAIAIGTLNSIYGKTTSAVDHPVEVKPLVTVDVGMDKDTYFFDDAVKVSGKVSKLGGTGMVMLLKLLDGEPSLSINKVTNFTPNYDGTFAVDTDLRTDQSGDWMMLTQYMGVSKSLLFDVEETPYRALAQTDKASYSAGDVVKINGNVTRYGDRVSIRVLNPDGINFAYTNAPISSDKKFGAEFPLTESKFTIQGLWTIRMTFADTVNDVTFMVENSLDSLRNKIPEKLASENVLSYQGMVNIKVQAKQIRDLVIIRVTNMRDNAVDVSGFRVSTASSQIIAVRGLGEWSSEDISNEGGVFLTSAEPIHAGDKAYFLLKMYGEKPLIKWTTFDPSKNKLAEGSVVPFMV
jgi:predicted Zn-dependent protease